MSTSHVITVSKETIKKMQVFYQDYLNFTPPPYTTFAAKKKGVTITAYTSGKVMFQGNGAEKEMMHWQDSCVSTSRSTEKRTSSLPPDFATWSVIGSDEVGNGSYFGPLVVCAAYVSRKYIPQLQQLGVKDSKDLTDLQIRKIATQIKEIIPFKLLTVTPEKYNEIQPKYNANKMKAVLHNQAISLLLNQIAPEKPEGILIDQFTPEKNYRIYIAQEKNQVKEKLYFITKGEHYHLAVAAASIFCRSAFLEALEMASQEAGMVLPSGAGKTADLVAAQLLKQGGLPLLTKYVKLHFANTAKAEKIAQKK